MSRRCLPVGPLGAIAWVLMGCGPGARVNLELDKTADVPALRSVVVLLRDTAADAPTVYGPINLDDNPQFRLQSSVEPGQEFYLDVLGCTHPSRCESDFVAARGCRNPMRLNQNEERNVRVMLYLSPGEYDLPPQPDVEDPTNGCPPVGPHSHPRP